MLIKMIKLFKNVNNFTKVLSKWKLLSLWKLPSDSFFLFWEYKIANLKLDFDLGNIWERDLIHLSLEPECI